VLQPNGTYVKLPIYLEVCGYEDILSTNDLILLKQVNLTNLSKGGDVVTLLLKDMFINSSPNNYCPIASYKLKAGNNSLSDMAPNLRPYIYLNDTHLTIQEYAPLATIAVMAETFNGQRGW
jgi:hypothetical protein